jgi:hypothetical protein
MHSGDRFLLALNKIFTILSSLPENLENVVLVFSGFSLQISKTPQKQLYSQTKLQPSRFSNAFKGMTNSKKLNQASLAAWGILSR